MSTIDPLAAAVFGSETFQQIIRSIRIEELAREFPNLNIEVEFSDVDWNFALLCASALTSVQEESAQKAVLRIAVGCLSSERSDLEHRSAATALLERSGNQLSVALARARGYTDSTDWDKLPIELKLETIYRKLELSLPLRSGASLAINRFQREFWDAATQNQWVSVSAPTSAGKSRIVREWVVERLQDQSDYVAVYLVPTRALVQEVAEDLRNAVGKSVGVHEMPWGPQNDLTGKHIFIQTQERFHLTLERYSNLNINLLFVDEAQNLGDGSRGVLLQQVVEKACASSPALQVIFASPLSDNPELLVDGKSDSATATAFISNAVTVNQNLIYVNGVKYKPLLREVSLVHRRKPEVVGSFEVPHRADNQKKRIAFVAGTLGDPEGGNLVYVNGASEAEDVAFNLFELSGPDGSIDSDEDIRALQELSKKAVHRNYALSDVLARGVAFHYGNMPQVLRAEIERLFSIGKIRYLVCTSTLLEGVNLPCKNIFMRNPKKGRDHNLTESEFWNLAGRAGRWGREFHGNIFCIDVDADNAWPSVPLERKRSTLRRSVHDTLEGSSALVQYLEEASLRPVSPSQEENVFSYLVDKHYNAGGSLERLAEIEDLHDRNVIENAIVSLAVVENQIPSSLYGRHPGVSPFGMMRLLRLFRQSDLAPHDLALRLPEEPSARSSYQRAFAFLQDSVTNIFSSRERQWQLANLCVSWMSGRPLPYLIQKRMDQRDEPEAKSMRDVMGDIEKFARFAAPKYLSCYLDVLSRYAQEMGVKDFDQVGDITQMLELGVSRQSQVVLMSLGLSRTSTIEVSSFVLPDVWSAEECLEWLGSQNLSGMNLPVLVQKEIQGLLDSYSVAKSEDGAGE